MSDMFMVFFSGLGEIFLLFLVKILVFDLRYCGIRRQY